jgi:hypothetical protein
MSNKKKPKKLRSPNVPSAAMTAAGVASQARGGGQETAGSTRAMRAAPAAAATQVTFDYTYVKKDLTRIAVLAGSFVLILVVLSFFIR